MILSFDNKFHDLKAFLKSGGFNSFYRSLFDRKDMQRHQKVFFLLFVRGCWEDIEGWNMKKLGGTLKRIGFS